MLIRQEKNGKHILIKEAYLWDFLRRKNKHYHFLLMINHNIEDASIVSLFEVYNIDYSICLLKDMPRGYYAIRENVESDWIVKK